MWKSGKRLLGLGVVVSLCANTSTALAHVGFTAPTEGQTLAAGSKVKVEWVDLIFHDPEGFDLDFLAKPDAAPTPIAHGLAIATHEYEWQVPNEPCDQCQLKVTQLNTINTDYEGFVSIVISNTAGPAGGSSAGGDSSTDPQPSTGGSTSSGASNRAGSATDTSGSGGGAGRPNPGGAGGSGGTGTDSAGSDDSSSDGGCSVSAVGSGTAGSFSIVLLAALGLARFRRRVQTPASNARG